ncbi:alpha/beta fold hydrolase [Bacillus carboniphilus]|uniref:Alpha/beta fold hydrolase n=1 Tax=Bacillus carboniphilus TaxID=86663 RepID=A0ABP3FNI1_9BACI
MIGCLIIHGFTGGPHEVEPLEEFLKQHTNWHVVSPTLPGHGEKLRLKGIFYYEWVRTAEEELKELLQVCDTVYVVGFSMGGMIASYLTVKYPVAKLVLLSAALYYINPRQLGIDIKNIMKDAMRGTLLQNELFQRYKRKIASTPISATTQFRKLVKDLRQHLPNVTAPTMIVQGLDDGVVPPKAAHVLHDSIGSEEKKLLFLEKAQHIICHCEEKDDLFQDILSFLGQEIKKSM